MVICNVEQKDQNILPKKTTHYMKTHLFVITDALLAADAWSLALPPVLVVEPDRPRSRTLNTIGCDIPSIRSTSRGAASPPPRQSWPPSWRRCWRRCWRGWRGSAAAATSSSQFRSPRRKQNYCSGRRASSPSATQQSAWTLYGGT